MSSPPANPTLRPRGTLSSCRTRALQIEAVHALLTWATHWNLGRADGLESLVRGIYHGRWNEGILRDHQSFVTDAAPPLFLCQTSGLVLTENQRGTLSSLGEWAARWGVATDAEGVVMLVRGIEGGDFDERMDEAVAKRGGADVVNEQIADASSSQTRSVSTTAEAGEREVPEAEQPVVTALQGADAEDFSGGTCGVRDGDRSDDGIA